MALRYETLDVFTNVPCGGNPLAVVYGAEDLSGRLGSPGGAVAPPPEHDGPFDQAARSQVQQSAK